MVNNSKRSLFENYSNSAKAAGLGTKNETLLCPLCWRAKKYDELSLEHIVPGSVGGKCLVLTCTDCNNSHGSLFDSHLAEFQKSKDVFNGHGKMPIEIQALGSKVAANLRFGEGAVNFEVVGKASNPTHVQTMQKDAATGRISELHISPLYKLEKRNFQTGILRCAYLALFKCLGFEYCKLEAVQTIRQRICNIENEQPRLGSLIGELRNGSFPFDIPYFIVPYNVNDVEIYMVAIRLKKETETLHFVTMPFQPVRSEVFFQLMEQNSKDNNRKNLTISLASAFM